MYSEQVLLTTMSCSNTVHTSHYPGSGLAIQEKLLTLPLYSPQPGLHLLTKCIYLETSASHLQYYNTIHPNFILPRRNNFRNQIYTQMFPPTLQVLKVTLSVHDFPVLDQLRRSILTSPVPADEPHLPILHDIFLRKSEDATFLPDLRRIIIEDRYNEPTVNPAQPFGPQIPRTPLVPGTVGMGYEFLYPNVYGWRPSQIRTFQTGTTGVPVPHQPCKLVRRGLVVGVEVVFTSQWQDHESNRMDGYPALWDYPEQIAEGPYVAPRVYNFVPYEEEL